MIVVVDVDDEGRRNHFLLVNPEVVSACGEEFVEEGCLSLPEIYARVRRPQSVVVKGLGASGCAQGATLLVFHPTSRVASAA